MDTHHISVKPSSNHLKIKLKFNHNSPMKVVFDEDQDGDDELEEGEIREEEDYPSINNNNNNTNQDYQEISGVINEGGGGLRVCPYCKKEFSNGKALGGHLRIHAENYKPKPNMKRPNYGASPTGSPGPDKPIRCSLCDKEFRSQKSLFGHMRSHPDRHWRGMQPPPGVEENLGSGLVRVDEFMAALERLKGLGGWGVTGVRGQNAGYYGTSSDEAMTSSDSGGGGDWDVEVAAGELMLLRGEGESGPSDRGGRKRVYEDVMMMKSNKKRKVEYDSDEVYYLENMGYLNDNDDDDVEREQVIVARKSVSIPRRSTTKNKGIIINEMNNNVNGNNGSILVNNNNNTKWTCNTCNKSFPTHQALGGHRSSHNKDRLNHHNNNPNFYTDPDLVDGSRSGSGGVGVGVIGIYKCKTCDKTFPSGQALGGHQRCHYVAQDPNSYSSASPGRSSSHSGRNKGVVNGFRELDLNTTPEEEVIEDQDDGVVESNNLELLSSS